MKLQDDNLFNADLHHSENSMMYHHVFINNDSIFYSKTVPLQPFTNSLKGHNAQHMGVVVWRAFLRIFAKNTTDYGVLCCFLLSDFLANRL